MIKKQVDFIRRKLPIFDWSPQYDIHKAVADLVAGITMGLTLIPQSLAYAPLAGLEPQVKTNLKFKLKIIFFYVVWLVLFDLWRTDLRSFRNDPRTEHRTHRPTFSFDLFLHPQLELQPPNWSSIVNFCFGGY